MNMKEALTRKGHKTLRVVMSAVLAVGLMPLPAFASDLQAGSLDMMPQATGAMSPNGLVTAAAHAAANPAPEILGLSNMNQRDQSNSGTPEWEVTYNFFGDPDVNSNPNPYLYNKKNGYTPSVYFGGRTGQSPMSGLNTYGTDSATNEVWNQQPMIVLGTGSDTIPANEHDFYNTASYARAVEKANGLDDKSYTPIGVTYNRNTLPDMVDTMYRFAEAADEVIANSETTKDNLSTATLRARYTDNSKGEKVVDIAKDYERYILGAKGLVKQAIDTGAVEQKTYAYVTDYTSSSSTYTLSKDGVEEGTATTSRFVEAVQGVATNLYSTLNATTAKKADLEAADLIIVNPATNVELTTITDALGNDGLLGKAYYCDNWANGSAFGTTVNSVENAQNIGRILPCLYPELLDQSDMIAYYYDVFYHVKDGKTAELIATRMDGVRNWAHTDSTAYTAWEATDVDGYNKAAVKEKLIAGVSYLNSVKANNPAALTSYLTPTDYLADDVVKADLANATVMIPSVESYTVNPSPVVRYGSTTLVKDSDYTVSWTQPASDATQGTVTITAKDSSTAYTGSRTATYNIVSTENVKDLTAQTKAASYDYTGSNITPEVTVKKGSDTLTEGRDYYLTYANNKIAANASATLAPTATVVGMGDYRGTKDVKFSIGKATTKLKNSNTKQDGKQSVTTTEITKAYGDAAFDCLVSADSAYDGQLEYTPGDASVITCNEKGVVTINKVGETTLKVTAPETNNCKGDTTGITLTIKVTALTPKIYINAATDGAIEKYVDSAVNFNLGAYSTSDLGDVSLTYKSSNENVATVDANGKVTLKQSNGLNVTGTSTITVSAAASGSNTLASSATATLTVRAYTPVITVPSASITKAADAAAFTIGATVASDKADASSSYKTALTYTSSNTNVATVNASTGMVTLKAAGKTNIVVTAPAAGKYESASKTVELTVTAAAAPATTTISRTISASNKTVKMGKTVKLGATLSAGGGTMTYASSNTKVAKVSAAGVVTPVKVGTANITISVPQTGNYLAASTTIKVTVSQGTQTLTFKKQTKTVKKGKTVAITKAKGAKTTVTYSITGNSAAKKAFTINKKTGKLTAKKAKKGKTYKVTVKATAAKNSNWKKATKSAVITVKVK